MKAQINISEQNEKLLLDIRKISGARNKEDQINKGLEWLADIFKYMDKEDLMNVLNIEL